MNIIKEILTLPKTNGGKKRRYKLLNRLGIKKKDKSEIAKAIDNGQLMGGGNGAEVKEWYYIIDVEKIVQDLGVNGPEDKSLVLNMIKVIYNPTAYLIAGGYDDNYDIGERINIEYNNAFFFDRLRAIKLSNVLCTEITQGVSNSFRVVRYYGNLEERTKIYKDFNITQPVDFTPYMTEISKEQYYGAIKLPIVEVNKD